MSDADAERRRIILDAAERLLRHYGPLKTTIADIAREASVGVGSVYLEFTSKDAILEELSTRRYAQVLAAMQEAAGKDGLRYEARLRAMLDARCEALLGVADAGPHARDLVHCGCAGVKTARERFVAAERALLSDLLRAGARAREFAVEDAESTTRALLRAYASFTPPWIFAAPPAELRQAHAAMHALVIYGLVRRDSVRVTVTTEGRGVATRRRRG
jgi:AcrR family transcriptional regulator